MRQAFRRESTTFFPNIVLGFNDALIELTGALIGFSFALGEPKTVAVAGLVTGISASLSMAASAYQQARYVRGAISNAARREKSCSPVKAALFTGVSYIVIALVLVLPFVFAGSNTAAVGTMGVLAFLVVAGLSVYSASLLKRSYLSQLGEMCLFSLGVATVTFLIGRALGGLIGL